VAGVERPRHRGRGQTSSRSSPRPRLFWPQAILRVVPSPRGPHPWWPCAKTLAHGVMASCKTSGK